MWYYVIDNQQRGPVTESDLEALLRAGTIDSETLIWREGIPQWRPYSELKGTPGAGSAQPANPGEVICVECGKSFPPSEVLQYAGSSVCAACKPVFVQKLKEGERVGSGLVLATIGARFGAKFLDGIILRLLQFVWMFAMVAILRNSSNNTQVVYTVVQLSFGVLVSFAYNWLFLAKFSATPGKMACKIKVVNADGGPISNGQAIARPLAEIVSGIICGIGYLMAIWDPEKRTLHDRMCNTRVVVK